MLRRLDRRERHLSLISYLTRVHFADRVLEDALSEEVARHRMARPLVISDEAQRGRRRARPLFDALPSGPRPCISRCEANGAPRAQLQRAAELCPKSGCDGIIGFGGMRPLDLARLIWAMRVRRWSRYRHGTETIGLGPLGAGFALQAPRRVRIPVAILCDATLTMDAARQQPQREEWTRWCIASKAF